MKRICVGAGVLNQTPLDWDGNAQRIRAAIQSARQQQVTLLCLPELCITGYGCEDAFHSVSVQETALQVLLELLPETVGLAVSVGLPLYCQGGLYNAACLLVDGRIAGFVGKQNLAGDGLHYEPRWFKAWPDDAVTTVRIAGSDYPLGDVLFDFEGVRVGFEICEDAWVAARPGSGLVYDGADLLLNPSASHFAFGKHQVRRRFVLDGSRAFHVAYVYANLVGNEAGRAIYDGDAMIACCGQMLATGPRFSFRESHVTSATIDVDAVRVSRARASSFRARVDTGAQRVAVPFGLTSPDGTTANAVRRDPVVDAGGPERVDWERGSCLKEEEFTRAMALGLFDYLRKSRSRGFVVSLSGGADSAAVAVLSHLMVTFSLAELGPAEVSRRLHGAVTATAESSNSAASALTAQLLTCVYQATRNSSTTTRDAAATVANAVGATFLELDVDGLVQRYVDLIGDALGRPLDWRQDDIALQNIQARTRGPSVWMLANLKGALLLATSNRSEAAVGYATMDGDTCGGLSPIAGIDKAFLRQWLRWMEQTGPRGGRPLPSLAAINCQAPTAELRPPTSHQTDEADLMPYDLLDAIERAAIRDKKSPREAFQLMREAFPQYCIEDLAVWVPRFFQLWCRNQWKRERYAPSFHLDDENLDPKTWCRFPILSASYARELRDLQAWISSAPTDDRSSSPPSSGRNPA